MKFKIGRAVLSALLLTLTSFSTVTSADLIIIDQERQIKQLIKKLAEPYDLAETITVIARIESNFGRYVVNLAEGSCGITQININTYIARHKITDTRFNHNKACSDLVNSYELSIANSIEELLYWKQQFCNKQTKKCTKKQFENVVRAYNGGWKGYKGKKTAEYYEKFKTFHAELFPKVRKISTKNKPSSNLRVIEMR